MTRVRYAAMTVTVLMCFLSVVSPPALAAEAPIEEIVQAHIGKEVDKTSGSNLCIVGAGQCAPAKASSEVGGFEAPRSLAVNNDPASALYHYLYVIDLTHRVQEFDPDGRFAATFGWNVNRTKIQRREAQEAAHEAVTVSQTDENVCSVGSGDVCQVGASGSAFGQFSEPNSIAVDPATGNVYVAEEVPGQNGFGERVQEFTPSGEPVLEIGKDVNGTTHENICKAQEAEDCTGPGILTYAENEKGTKEADAFAFPGAPVLTFGGPEDLLYVGEHGRIQKLAADGRYIGQMGLGFLSALSGSGVTAIGADSSGNVYIVYRELDEEVEGIVRQKPAPENADIVYELGAGGNLIAELRPNVEEPEGIVEVMALSVDQVGHLAFSETETYRDKEFHTRIKHSGRLYLTVGGRLHLMTQFSNPSSEVGGNSVGINSLSFDDKNHMYATDFYYTTSEGYFAHEVISYKPVPVAELLPLQNGGNPKCSAGKDRGADATFDCRLEGDVNPEGVSETEAWFQWGLEPTLGKETLPQDICSTACGFEPVAMTPAVLEGLLPNQAVFFRLAGHDANVKAPEQLSSEQIHFTTPTAPPRVVGPVTVAFVGPFSAVFEGNVNMENSPTRYFFEYVPVEKGDARSLADLCPRGLAVETCEGVQATSYLESSDYGAIATALEARKLQPETEYRYRMMAVNRNLETAVDEHGHAGLEERGFTTAPVPPPGVVTEPVSAIGTTTATVTGTVDPEGQVTTYGFELGVYNGAHTQLALISSGSVGRGTSAVVESVSLSALQPGTVYAYRIRASNGGGTSYGTTREFTTVGFPVHGTPSVVPEVEIPPYQFPARKATLPCKRGHKGSKGGRCKKQRQKNARHRRAARRHKK